MLVNANTVVTKYNEQNIEVYEHDIFYYADEYISNNIPNPTYKDIRRLFPALLLYISDHIEKPNINDIQLLDKLFNIYIRLCSKYAYNPSVDMFCILISVDFRTISNWSTGNCRNTVNGMSSINSVSINYQDLISKWRHICRAYLAADLANTDLTSANKIFIAKSVYGMVETAPVQVKPVQEILSADELPRLDMQEDPDGSSAE